MQVYKGRMRSTGEEVAVKVQRPGIAEGIAVDMVLLRRLMTRVDAGLPQLSGLDVSVALLLAASAVVGQRILYLSLPILRASPGHVIRPWLLISCRVAAAAAALNTANAAVKAWLAPEAAGC